MGLLEQDAYFCQSGAEEGAALRPHAIVKTAYSSSHYSNTVYLGEHGCVVKKIARSC